MNEPLVSFVLPAFKVAYLHDAIAGILAQDYPNLEIIVVDDASPENLEAIVSGFKDARVTYFRNAENIGGHDLVRNWNQAVRHARGEFCVLASDDDIYAPTYLSTMVALAESHSRCDIFHCRIGMIDAAGTVTKIAEKRPLYESCADMMYARGIKRCLQVAPEFFFRRSALERIGGFVNFPVAWYSDEATWYALAAAGGAYCAEEVLFYWRYSGENLSSSGRKVRQKVLASEAYKRWVAGFLDGLTPENSTDEAVIAMCRRLVPEYVDQQTLFDLSEVSLCEWVKIVTGVPMPRRLKLRALKGRVSRLWR